MIYWALSGCSLRYWVTSQIFLSMMTQQSCLQRWRLTIQRLTGPQYSLWVCWMGWVSTMVSGGYQYWFKCNLNQRKKEHKYNLYLNMDEPSENYDIEEAQDPIDGPPEGNNPGPEYDSDDEDELPEFASDENKKLNQLVREKKRIIKQINKEYEKNFERKKILEEHLKNVEQELLHTKSLIDNKNKETETENHLWQVSERQCGRLESEVKKLNKVMLENDERLNDIQVRIFRTNEKVEQIKLELNWNQEELEQWAITGKQKEQDNVTLQKYHKEDESKIRELNLQIEKLTMEVNRKQTELDKEITETQTTQIELDKTAQQFKKEHDERHKLFEKWQDVTKIIAKRDQDIISIGMKTQDIKERIDESKEVQEERFKQLEMQKRINREQEAKVVIGNRDISERKNENKRMEFEAIANLSAEVEILKNQLSSFGSELAQKRRKLDLQNKDLLAKKQRLMNEEEKFKAHQIKLKNEMKLAEKFDAAMDVAEENFKAKEAEKKRIEQDISQKKDVLVKNTQGLFKLREQEASLYIEIQGIMATCRNLQAHINKLNQDFQKQQELLYNAEYQIQLMERKVARARGERTLEEKKDLQKDLDEASKKNTDMKTQHKILNDSVKRLDEDLRAVKNRLGDVKNSEKKLSSQIEEVSLENDMTLQDLNRVSKKKEEVLVQHDIMKLEIRKIKNTLGKATDTVYTLENKKNQLEMTMQEREKEILVHRDVLLAEHKAIEDERHKIAIELAERRTKVKNLKIKYESLVQKAHGTDGGTAEHSQAYYVIKAAQEKEELQRKGDQLGAKIIKAEKELKALENSRIALENINLKKRVTLNNKGVSKDDLSQKEALEEQVNAASENLSRKRKEIQKLEQEYEQDMRRLTETQNKYETLRDRKMKLEQVLFTVRQDLSVNEEKAARAQKSLGLAKTNLVKKKIEIKEDSPDIIQLEYDIEVDKNKTIVSTLLNLGAELPELGPLIEDTLRENNVEIQSKAPSSVSMMSSRGSMSIKSGGSAISRGSRNSSRR